MNIPSSIVLGLSKLKDLDEANLGVLVDNTYDLVIGKLFSEGYIDKISGNVLSESEFKHTVDNLLLFITEICHQNLNVSVIRQQLEDLDLSAAQISRFVSSHKVKQLTLKSQLYRFKPALPSIQDVKWSVEFTKDMGSGLKEVLFNIVLITDREPIQFFCNSAELSDLLSQLQSATFSIERYTSQ